MENKLLAMPHRALVLMLVFAVLLACGGCVATSQRGDHCATHPTTPERITTLRDLADKTEKAGGSWTEAREEYLNATKPYRKEWLREEVQKCNTKGSMVFMSRLLKDQDDSAEVHFFLGELYRLR